MKSFLFARWKLVGLVALVAVAVRCADPRPPPATVEGLARLLAHAASATVRPGDIAWEPSVGVLREALFGRRILFLASDEPGGPRDVHRALVRLSVGGQPISVHQVKNLTNTPLGDDTALEIRQKEAVFATVAYGRIQAITVLDVGGIPSDDRPTGIVDRALLVVSSLQRTGSVRGVGRTDIVLDLPAERAKLTLDGAAGGERRLAVDLGDPGRALSYDLRERVVRGPDGGQPYAAHAARQIHGAKPLIHWAVDTVRHEVGPGPIAWLEEKVFGARDTLKRTTYSLISDESERVLKVDLQEEAPAASILEASKVTEATPSWPPPSVPSIWQQTKPGEGEWEPVVLPWLKPVPGTTDDATTDAYFQRTVIRPDADRPYSELLIVAMDMRRLELGMEAGFEDPEPLTGPPGAGRLPREKDVLDRVVATFNGAFKTTHGKYGMMVNRRVLLPPVPGAATVMVTDDGRVGVGSWPASEAIAEDIVSFRQNLDPLVEDGVANPTGRNIWGWQLSGTSIMTERTAMCVTPAGHLYYFWGAEMDGPTLGKALRQAGCSYGIHLDMNPRHCGFVFTDIVDMKSKEFHLQRADDRMGILPDKFVRWSPKDFFYVMVRDPRPRDPGGVRWVADAGLQPPPSAIPAVFSGRASVGNLDVDLTSFAAGRVEWRARAGSNEPTQLGNPPKKLELEGDDKFRAVAAVGLGHTTPAVAHGLAFDGGESLTLARTYATLVLPADGFAELHGPGRIPPTPARGEAVQLPLLADEGRLVDRALDHGSLRQRGAICVLSSGRVVVASARHDSYDPLGTVLLRLGCKRVASLDRGSRHPVFVHRAGTATPPLGAYETSVLYALSRPMIPHAFRWKAAGSAPSTKPTGFDHPAKPKRSAPK